MFQNAANVSLYYLVKSVLQKSPCPSKANCHARLSMKTVISIISFTDENIFTVATPNKSSAVAEMGDRGHAQ